MISELRPRLTHCGVSVLLTVGLVHHIISRYRRRRNQDCERASFGCRIMSLIDWRP